MSEITHSDELVTKTDLSNFYQTILPYLGGMPEALANKFSRGDIYSTTEKIIGQWTDGKPLYQKTVSCGALPNASYTTTAHGVANIDSIVGIIGMAVRTSDHISLTLPYASVVSAQDSVAINASRSSIRIDAGNDKHSFDNSYVTIQYTKTTDPAVSIGNDTDYSTTEKIVGTWIDGKPIYQKTIETTTPSDNVAKYVSIGAPIDKVICIHGFCLQQGGYILPNSFWATSIANSAVRGFKVMVNNNSTPANPNCLGISAPGMDDIKNQPAWVTIQYTKTS